MTVGFAIAPADDEENEEDLPPLDRPVDLE
jgi:hypothetical protein